LESNCEIALTCGDCCGRVIEKEKDVLGKIGKEEGVLVLVALLSSSKRILIFLCPLEHGRYKKQAGNKY
jgi:phage I-like protein